MRPLRKFKSRLLLYIFLGTFFGASIGWLLSQLDLNSLDFSRRAIKFKWMLNLMSPRSWAWVIFSLMLFGGLIGDWLSNRFKDLTEEDVNKFMSKYPRYSKKSNK